MSWLRKLVMAIGLLSGVAIGWAQSSTGQLAAVFAMDLNFTVSKCSNYFASAHESWSCLTAMGDRTAAQSIFDFKVDSEPGMSWRSPWTEFETSVARVIAWGGAPYQVNLFWANEYTVLMLFTPHTE